MFGQAGEESVTGALGSAQDVMKAISWWTIAGLREDTRGHLPAARLEPGQLRGPGPRPRGSGWALQRQFLPGDISRLRRTDSVWCLCCLAPRSSASVDVNLLCVRASVHSAVSLLWYYTPVCFSKGSPITLHLGRDACELWMHRARDCGCLFGLWVLSSVLFHGGSSIFWTSLLSLSLSAWLLYKKQKELDFSNTAFLFFFFVFFLFFWAYQRFKCHKKCII